MWPSVTNASGGEAHSSESVPGHWRLGVKSSSERSGEIGMLV